MTTIERETLLPGDQTHPHRRIDVDQALTDLRYAATDLVELTHTAAQLPEPLIRSELLFAPARILPSTMERVNDRNQKVRADPAQGGRSAHRHRAAGIHRRTSRSSNS